MSANKLTFAFIIIVYTLAYLFAMIVDKPIHFDAQSLLLPFILMGMYPPFLPVLTIAGLTVTYTGGVIYPSIAGALLVAVVSIVVVYIVSWIIVRN